MYFSLIYYFFFSLLIFLIGLFGLILSIKNNFLLLISLEILFIAINLNFVITSLFIDDLGGMLFLIFILAVSGAEISVGLALFILIYKHSFVLNTYSFSNIKG